MPAIRVLVAEDSLTIRKYLCEVLAAAADVIVVGEAEDGKRAIELCAELRPDVVTMDMMMPVMTGLAATEFIMAYCPTPILIVSSSTNRGEIFKTYDALAAGAVDVLDKPLGDETNAAWENKFIATVRLVSRIRTITHPRARLAGFERKHLESIPQAPIIGTNGKRVFHVVGIGASTGGPGAIAQILRALPADFQLPILLVLHIGEPFGESFADWLDSQTSRPVSCAKDGTAVATLSGQVVLAPPNRHLLVQAGRIRLTQSPERHSVRPSVDVLFESLAAEYGSGVVTCLLTGMGRDGAAGTLAVHRAGGLTFAQDETSSVVYGMPREAVLLNAVDHVLPLIEIAPALTRLVAMDAGG
ncbi:MAG TPA: chemotaxis-specific protein-glutamate methyltransferase CheB [Phototrophicaceae bacterium]|nr:chemotaxis-specific protein-glutamate methyltransferase CheB [Phototrophicaceae bacterium]